MILEKRKEKQISTSILVVTLKCILREGILKENK